jgi:hypothetical protein
VELRPHQRVLVELQAPRRERAGPRAASLSPGVPREEERADREARASPR